MVALRTHASVLLLTTCLGCFREATAPPLHGDDELTPPTTIAITDAAGARFADDAAPRDLSVLLAFSGPPRRAPALLLLRGRFHDDFAARIGARPSARVEAATLAVTLTSPADDVVRVTPADALQPGGDYTVIWRAPARDRALSQGTPALAFPFTVSASPALGARAVALSPGDGARAVPPNLARTLVRFDGALTEDAEAIAAHVQLRDAHGGPVATTLALAACAPLGLGSGACVALVPMARLATQARYELAVTRGLHAQTGAEIGPVSARFETAEVDDHEPPSLLPARCAPDEIALGPLCALLGDRLLDVRGSLAEPAELSVGFLPARAPPSAATTPAQWTALARERSFSLRDLPRGDASVLAVRLRDLAGNLRDAQFALPPAPTLAALSIDEVRADPHGKEPAQEYVELLNSGPTPVSTMGFTLSTHGDRARPLLGAHVLAPGERALIVGPDFDAHALDDGPLPSGLALIQVASALALANDGEAVQLHDPRGRRVSAAAALAPLLEGQCIARRGDDPRSGDAARFAHDPDGGCTPGRATFAPPARSRAAERP